MKMTLGLQTDNLRMLRKLAVVAVLMFGFGYALIPIYRAICELTGINILALGEKSCLVQAMPAWLLHPPIRK